MYKIGLFGKANVGKNTTGDIIISELEKLRNEKLQFRSLAFADPVKNIVKMMFPKVQINHLFGPSHFRNTIIEDARDKNGRPLTIRQALLDVGTGLGRAYNDNIWLDNMASKIEEAESDNIDGVVITDVRFKNEFYWLKSLNFKLIKIERETHVKISHVSETLQDSIPINDFDFVVQNNGTLDELAGFIKSDVISIL